MEIRLKEIEIRDILSTLKEAENLIDSVVNNEAELDSFSSQPLGNLYQKLLKRYNFAEKLNKIKVKQAVSRANLKNK